MIDLGLAANEIFNLTYSLWRGSSAGLGSAIHESQGPGVQASPPPCLGSHPLLRDSPPSHMRDAVRSSSLPTRPLSAFLFTSPFVRSLHYPYAGQIGVQPPRYFFLSVLSFPLMCAILPLALDAGSGSNLPRYFSFFLSSFNCAILPLPCTGIHAIRSSSLPTLLFFLFAFHSFNCCRFSPLLMQDARSGVQASPRYFSFLFMVIL